ncbi:MAG: UvrD-helicase domain-containing protein [Gammaproteobacteria bacterium]|nr:UvrD-helicase domain-containing protein [Gammaproteobacteria bacterium]
MSKPNFTLSQFLALDTQRNIAVSAGAGAGKTAVLTQRLIKLLENPELDITRVLVVTFTDKAASEMKARVYKAIDERIAGQGADLEHWKHLKENFLHNHITTFHAFCSGLLKRYPVQARVDPGFRIITDFEQRKLLNDAISKHINITASNKPEQKKGEEISAEELSERQAARKADRKHLRYLIKTWGRNTILSSIKYLIDIREDARVWVGDYCELDKKRYLHDLKVYRSTVLQKIFRVMLADPVFQRLFTEIECLPAPADNSQASQRRRTLLALYKDLKKIPLDEVDKLLEVCAKIDDNIQFRGKPPKVWLTAGENAWDRYKTAALQIKAWFTKSKLFSFTFKKQLEEEGYRILTALANLTRACSLYYQTEKDRQLSMDFADLQLKVLDLLRAAPALCENLRRQFRYLMVDEFQDTNNLQWEIIREIASDRHGLLGDKLFIVGDEKQAIYSFRGGDVTVFSKVRQAICAANLCHGTAKQPFLFQPLPEAQADAYRRQWEDLDEAMQQERQQGIILFEDNFRSARLPIAFINGFFQRLLGKEAYEDFEAKPQSLVCKGNLNDGGVELLLVQKQSAFDDKDAGAWELANMDNYLKEAHLIAHKIKEILHSDDPGFTRTRDMVSAREPAIAILLNRRTKIKIYEEALRREDIDFRVHKGKGFYQRQEIMDLANVLEFIADPRSDIALTGILRSPLGGLSDDGLLTLYRLTSGQTHGSQSLSLWQRFSRLARDDGGRAFNSDDSRAMNLAHRNLRGWLHLKDRISLSQLLHRIIDDSGFTLFLARGKRGEQSLSNVEKLIEQAREFEVQNSGLVYDFVQYLNAQIDENEDEGEADMDSVLGSAVQLMTVHQAKGLEFPVVFVPDLSAGFNFGANLSLYKDRIEYDPQFATKAPGKDFDGLQKIFEIGIKAPDAEEDFDEGNTLLRNIIYKMNVDKIRAERKRLFYVAMTRAMDYLYLVGQIKAPSTRQLALDQIAGFDDYNNWSEWLRIIMSLNDIDGMTSATLRLGDEESLQVPVTLFGQNDRISEYAEVRVLKAAALLRKIEAVEFSKEVRTLLGNLEMPDIFAPKPQEIFQTPQSASGKIVLQAENRRLLETQLAGYLTMPSALYLCPQSLMAETLAARYGEQVKAELYTLDDFIQKLYSESGETRVFIDAHSREAVLRGVLKEHGGGLKHYSEVYQFAGIVKQFGVMTAWLNEQDFDDPRAGLRQALHTPQLGLAEQDFLYIFAHYREALREAGLIDREIRQQEVLRLLRAGQTIQADPLILDDFYYLSPLELKLARKLIEKVPNVVITLEHGEEVIENDSAVTLRFRSFLSELEAGQGLQHQVTEATARPATKIHMYNAPSRNEEIAHIARRLRAMLAQQKNPVASDFMLAVPDLSPYLSLIQDRFQAYNLPYTLVNGLPLHNTQLVALLLKILDLHRNQFPREGVFALFTSSLISFQCPVAEVRAGLQELSQEYGLSQALIDDLADRGGDKASLDILELETVLRSANIAHVSNPEYCAERISEWLEAEHSDESARNTAKVAVFAQLYVLSQAVRLINNFRSSMTATDFKDTWLALIETFDIRRNLERTAEELQTCGQAERKDITAQGLKILAGAAGVLKKMEAELEGSAQPLKLLVSVFDTNLQEHVLTHGDADGVRVLTLNDLPGQISEVLFLAGLADGEFPPLPETEFIPGSADLQGADPMQKGRYLFARALRNTAHAYLSCPESSGGKRFLVSPFVQELSNTGAVEQGEDEFTADELKSFSQRDALAFIARSVEEDRKSALPVFRALQAQSPQLTAGLIKGLEIAGQRESIRSFDAYDGLLFNKKNLALLRARFSNGSGSDDKEHHFTIAQLEDYALCPIRFFYRHVLELLPQGFYLDDYENSDKSELVHAILTDFYQQHIKNAKPSEAGRLNEEELGQAEKSMKTLAEAAIEAFPSLRDNLFWSSEKETLVRGLDQDLQKARVPRGFLKAFLEFEINSGHRMHPHRLRFAFGKGENGDNGENGKAFYIEHVPIAGQIDRIDVCEDNAYLIFMDYRVSHFPLMELVGKGLSFQLPLHWLALEEYAQEQGYRLGAGGYYQVRSPKQIKHTGWFGREDIKSGSKSLGEGQVLASRQRSFGFFTDSDLITQLNIFRQRILQVDRNISEGKFHPPLARDDNLPCQYCPYAKICRKDLLRLDKIYEHIDGEIFYKPLRFLDLKTE